MTFSILIPSRNGVEFLEWAYNSIRKNQGDHFVEIIVLDDISDKDNTWAWCEKTEKEDINFRSYRNNTETRLGISGGYKFLSQTATQDVICHWHNDMFMTEGTLDAVAKVLYPGKVICLTRIEPPIYGPGVEKIIWKEAPLDLEDWSEEEFLNYLLQAKKEWGDKTTKGHFAPFFMRREDYLSLGGNDIKNFPLQAREDSDWAFRLVLAGYETIQIPQFTFHFASRGNRRSKHETSVMKDNPAWEKINMNSTKNFIRKWGTLKLHDEYLKPTPPKKYNIGFVVDNCTWNLLGLLEPWCDQIQTNLTPEQINDYIEKEQPHTPVNLKEKINNPIPANIIVYINAGTLTAQDFNDVQQLSEIITNSGDIGEFALGNLRIEILSLESYEKDLIFID